jgi:hypothetical protein
MVRRSKEALELLAVAARLRDFAREATDDCYPARFRRGANQLELEAMGCASADAVAQALRAARTEFQNTRASC